MFIGNIVAVMKDLKKNLKTVRRAWKNQFGWLRIVRRKLTPPVIKNYFRTNYNKNALISYVTRPFRKGVTFAHTNSIEALEIAKVFRRLAYNVDVVDFDYEGRGIDYSKYSVIFGFGDPLVNSFYKRKHPVITIYYGTGMHVVRQNHAALKRVKEVYKKKGVWMPESGRIVDKAWSVQTTLVNNIITLGNDSVIESYRKYFDGGIYNIPVSCYKIFDYKEILSRKNHGVARKHFLWFGSSGLIHKGLDLLLEVFKELPDVHLYVCGPINQEKKFQECYYGELYNTPNIHTYGYVDIKTLLFKEIISKCGFVILPSCAEGEPSSVINVMCYGLIPIVPRSAGIRIKDFGLEIKQLTHESLTQMVKRAAALSEEEMTKRSFECAEDTVSGHSIEKFSEELENSLKEIFEMKKITDNLYNA
ncbi:MAG: glycosyltransferase [bacterium]